VSLSANHESHLELELTQALTGADKTILAPEAMSFLADLANRFTPELKELLAARKVRQLEFDEGAVPGFDLSTREIREGDWQVAPIPAEIADRRTEITGPVTRKMVINALNSGAQVYMADFEEEKTPLLAAAPESFGPSIRKATALLQRMTSNPELDEFLTLPAYEQLID